MSRSNSKINFLQLCMILMLMNGLTDHVIINPLLLDASGRDAWIAVICTAFWFLPWCALIVYIMRSANGERIQPWLAKQTSPVISWLLLTPIILQLYLIGGMTVEQTVTWTATNYLPATPTSVLTIVLVLVCLYAANYGLKAIAISSGILLPTVIGLGFFVAIANIPEKDYGMLKPFLENGWKPVYHGMVFAGGSFSELFLILLLQHRLKSGIKSWKLMLLALILIYITLGPIVGAITEFGPQEAAKQMVSPYEQWRLVRLGDYIEHVDFLSVYQWLAGATVRISVAMFLLADLLPIHSPKVRQLFLWGLTLSYVGCILFTNSQNALYLRIYQSYFPITLVVTLLLSVVTTGIAFWSRKKGEIRHERTDS
ncbi:GerAB/ArcD/ProY family transporter [Paenibacillus oceani]|uniref:Endospore germination permease n=1 Tax=Paenibacillus oceani TaxID=2772510 RepID=A0A927CGH9_9BACL|nr:endospore germination permease [Paenibacillus oceani]MBD2865526.1 endospore germination permease [Paenibacillus oceani]